jgi:hypothetical protein
VETASLPVSAQYWTAKEKLGPQKSDLLSLRREGQLLSNAHFEVRPDYFFRNWYAGFRLTSATDDPQRSDLTATVLFYVCDDDRQPRVIGYVEGRALGPFALRQFEWPRPSFDFDISICSAGTGELCVIVSVDKECVKSAIFPRRYAEQLVLVAWADGRDFRIHFEQISTNWVPATEAHK